MIKTVLALYPGRYQPFSAHHYAAFRWLQNKFGKDKSFIVTSDKVEPNKSPLNFEEKKAVIDMYGLGDSVIQVKSPYKAEELTQNYDPNNTALVFMVGKKDMQDDPRFAMKPKKDGSPSYFQPYEKNKDNLEPMTKHGYLIIAPHVSMEVPGYGELSGTQARAAIANTKSDKELEDLFRAIFKKYDPKIAKMLKQKFSKSQLQEAIKKILFEGGNIFKTETGESATTRINRADVEPTIKWLEKLTSLPLIDNMLGSTGKKDTSGDLDIAVDETKISKDELVNKLIKSGFDKSYVKKSGDSVHFKTAIRGDEKNGFVQTDFMFGNPDWMKFSMTGGHKDSEFKGVHRHLLLSSVAKAQGLKWSYKNGLMNRETNETITKDPDKIANLLLGKGKKGSDLESVESIISAIKDRSDYDSLVQYAKEDFKRYNLELPTLNESIVLSEAAEARIQHPEDMIFWNGSKGALDALSILANLGKTTEGVSIKWDGSPAVVFGRKEDGTFVLTDKSGFTAKGYDGKATSGKALAQMFMNRLKGREDVGGKYKAFATSMGKVFDYFEKSTPKDIRGYFNGDLLYQQTPKVQDGNYTFTPNITTYSVPVDSELGNKIGNSNVGVVVHSFMDLESNKTTIKDINDYGFDDSKGLLVVPPTSISETPKINTSAIKSIMSKIKSSSSDINSFMDKSNLSSNKISNLPDLMYKYNNSKVGNTKDLGKDFLDFIDRENLTTQKKEAIKSYVKDAGDTLSNTFSIVSDIMMVKDDIIKQVDSQDSEIKANIGDIPGGEGYVISSPKGTIKLVNRAGFTAANRAVKR